MSFLRYPSYRDSGVEWLGEVPSHWKTAPLKAVSTHNDDVLDENTAPETEIVYADISSVDGVLGIHSTDTMSFSSAPSRARRRVKHGDVIVSTVRTYLKAIAQIRDPQENLIVSTGFAVIRPRRELLPSYLGYMLSAGYFLEQVIARSTGVSYPAINASELVAIPVTVPPISEQEIIAKFLDRETATIDALVREQKQLLVLLNEKRQAIISRAVTQGLDPKVRMNPSNMDGLGEFPQHWSCGRFSRVILGIKDGTHGTFERVSTGRPLLSAKNVQDGSLYLSDGESLISESDHASIISNGFPAKGDVLLTIVGTIGRSCVYELDYAVAFQRSVCFIRLLPNNDSKYFCYFMQSKWFQDQLISRTKSAAQGGVYMGDVVATSVVVPPPSEQIKIAAFLDYELSKIAALAAEAQRAIDLLQERRTALISTTVTGRIDVRSVAAKVSV